MSLKKNLTHKLTIYLGKIKPSLYGAVFEWNFSCFFFCSLAIYTTTALKIADEDCRRLQLVLFSTHAQMNNTNE